LNDDCAWSTADSDAEDPDVLIDHRSFVACAVLQDSDDSIVAFREIYRLAMREGYADQDFAALYAFLNPPADQRASVPELVRHAD
jgi:hypothetical protein